jgi:hypothetical protein
MTTGDEILTDLSAIIKRHAGERRNHCASIDCARPV